CVVWQSNRSLPSFRALESFLSDARNPNKSIPACGASHQSFGKAGAAPASGDDKPSLLLICSATDQGSNLPLLDPPIRVSRRRGCNISRHNSPPRARLSYSTITFCGLARPL
ncbi:hypothetical protein CLAIMM_15056, partial [Cladophialophora immunda]